MVPPDQLQQPYSNSISPYLNIRYQTLWYNNIRYFNECVILPRDVGFAEIQQGEIRGWEILNVAGRVILFDSKYIRKRAKSIKKPDPEHSEFLNYSEGKHIVFIGLDTLMILIKHLLDCGVMLKIFRLDYMAGIRLEQSG